MSMSTHIRGYKPADLKWKRMKDAFDACNAAGIAPPKEVMEFFEYDTPSENGVLVDISMAAVSLGENCGYTVDITKLPKDVTVIKFENSW